MAAADLPRPGLRLVVALACEARPLIQYFQLHPLQTGPAHPFPIYHDRQEARWLIISGVGRHAASIATAYLAGVSQAGKTAAWLNVGLAGHASLPLGTLRAVHQITQTDSDFTGYPSLPPNDITSASLLTVDAPQECLPDNLLVDMEGAGFWAAAATFATAELVQCLKVVSDHGMPRHVRPSKQEAQDRIQHRLPEITGVAEDLLALSAEITDRLRPPIGWLALQQNFRFTATQTNQLRDLLRRWEALVGPDENAILQRLADAPSSKIALARLQEHLDAAQLRLPPA